MHSGGKAIGVQRFKSAFIGLLKCWCFMHIPTMDQQLVKDPVEEPMVQKQAAPKVSNLPKTSLHDTDIKFISEAVKVISNIDCASQLKVRVHGKLPSVFTLAVTKPPRLCPDDLQQLQMLTTRVRKIKFDFHLNKMTIECWKHRKEPTTKKRDREDDMVGDHQLPKSYSLDMVDRSEERRGGQEWGSRWARHCEDKK